MALALLAAAAATPPPLASPGPFEAVLEEVESGRALLLTQLDTAGHARRREESARHRMHTTEVRTIEVVPEARDEMLYGCLVQPWHTPHW